MTPFRTALQSPSAMDASASRGASCTVLLERLSYDDPGVDDEEWIQLDVVTDGSATTFADCGVGALDLLNGSGADCSVYESIALGSLPIPSDGKLVICSPQSTLGAACRGTSDDGGVLGNGWLQNGPDALRLTSLDGTALWSAGYGGGVPCDVDESLPRDRDVTSASGTTLDGVLVRCGNEFVLMAGDEAMPGREASCPAPTDPAEETPASGGTPSASSSSEAPSAPTQPMPAAASTTAEVPCGADMGQPAVSPLNSGTPQATSGSGLHGSIADAGVRVVSRAVVVDAADDVERNTQGVSAADRHPPKLPSAGCQLSPRKGTALFGSLWSSLAVGLVACAIRRRLARAAPRCFETVAGRLTRARLALRCELRPRR